MYKRSLVVVTGIVGAVGSTYVGAGVVLIVSLLLRTTGSVDDVADVLLPVFCAIKLALRLHSWLALAIVPCAVLGARAIASRRDALPRSAIMLYDGECAMCNGWVSFCFARDPGERFAVAPLDSDTGRRLMTNFGVAQPPSSFVLIEGGRAYTRSDAALRCLSLLSPSTLFLLAMLMEPIPRPVRDAAYGIGWRYRRRIFGTVACRRWPRGRELSTDPALAVLHAACQHER